MAIRGLRSGVLSGALAVIVALTVVTPAAATPRPALPLVDYPSWDQVEAARGNQAATAATIATLDQLLGQLQAESARLGDEAVKRAAESDAAQTQLEHATASATTLARQADAAAQASSKSTQRAGAIVAALYRSGGTDLSSTLLLTRADSSSNLLYQLGALGKLGAQLDLAVQKAQADRNQAAALSAQATVARNERERLAAVAKTALATARAALDAANAAVATQQANLAQLYAQLASLKNTTAQVEQAYAIGLQQSNDGGGGDGTVTDVPSSGVNDPAAAQAFAWAILAGYGFGQDQDNCLLWLWNRESGWRTNAYNPAGPAYGIPQSLPGSKMAAVGADWRTNYRTQVTWGIIYIMDRYGSPCGAWAHSEAIGWY
ncbi:MAG: lytic transglycosylase protein [Rhodoglobus sp.]|nr:lytic transglycosylase protein [Rhodoglobus sp.]